MYLFFLCFGCETVIILLWEFVFIRKRLMTTPDDCTFSQYGATATTVATVVSWVRKYVYFPCLNDNNGLGIMINALNGNAWIKIIGYQENTTKKRCNDKR